MREIEPGELFTQLRSMVELLAAGSEEQLQWLADTNFPVEELLLQVYDSVPAWLPRLVEHDLLSSAVCQNLSNFSSRLAEISTSAPEGFFGAEGLGKAPEWDQIRELARRMLAILDGPTQ